MLGQIFYNLWPLSYTALQRFTNARLYLLFPRTNQTKNDYNIQNKKWIKTKIDYFQTEYELE